MFCTSRRGVVFCLCSGLLLLLGAFWHTPSARGDGSTISNDRLAVLVGPDGRFNIGAAPDTSGGRAPNSWDLMYRWPDTPGTSFSTVRVDGVDQVYGADTSPVQAPQNIDATTNRSEWQYGDIQITQTLQITGNLQTGQPDTAKITYTVHNAGSQGHDVGLRSMMDTELNYNDGAPFRVPGAGIITTEREFTGAQIPDTFQVFYSVTDAQHIAAATLRGNGATPPDRLVLTQWPEIHATEYDYTIDPTKTITSDTAYALYWNPTQLAAGGTRSYVTYYGVSQLNVDLRPPLALGLDGPAVLAVSNGQYSPNPFHVVATLLNNGSAPASNVQLTLQLGSGLELASGALTRSLGDLTPNDERQVAWNVRAVNQAGALDTTYAVTASADNADTKTVSKRIHLPAAPQLPGPPTSVRAQSPNGRTVTVSWTAPASTTNGPYTGYEVSLYDETAGTSSLVKRVNVDATTSSASFVGSDGVSNCVQYVVQVRARNVLGWGRVARAAPVTPVLPVLLSNGQPTAAVVLLPGLNSHLDTTSAFDPLRQNQCDLSKNPAMSHVADTFDTPGAGSSADGLTLARALAKTGTLLLPFSYLDPPMFTLDGKMVVGGYAPNTPNDANIAAQTLSLDTEIQNIRTQWRNTHITVMGHSEGGLLAQNWWAQYKGHASTSNNVVGVFSLDGPVNGFNGQNTPVFLQYVAPWCLTPKSPCQAFTAFETGRWDNKPGLDQQWSQDDSSGTPHGIYRAIGTAYDAVMTLAAYPCGGTHTQMLGQFDTSWLGQLQNAIDPETLSHKCGETPNFYGQSVNRETKQLGLVAGANILDTHSVVLHDPSNIQYLANVVDRGQVQ